MVLNKSHATFLNKEKHGRQLHAAHIHSAIIFYEYIKNFSFFLLLNNQFIIIIIVYTIDDKNTDFSYPTLYDVHMDDLIFFVLGNKIEIFFLES